MKNGTYHFTFSLVRFLVGFARKTTSKAKGQETIKLFKSKSAFESNPFLEHSTIDQIGVDCYLSEKPFSCSRVENSMMYLIG